VHPNSLPGQPRGFHCLSIIRRAGTVASVSHRVCQCTVSCVCVCWGGYSAVHGPETTSLRPVSCHGKGRIPNPGPVSLCVTRIHQSRFRGVGPGLSRCRDSPPSAPGIAASPACESGYESCDQQGAPCAGTLSGPVTPGSFGGRPSCPGGPEPGAAIRAETPRADSRRADRVIIVGDLSPESVTTP
jgi:hypothetical protein